MATRKATQDEQRRISKYDEEKLYFVVNSSLEIADGDSQDEIARKERKAAKLKAFQEKYAKITQSKTAQKEPKRLTYETIPEFLKVTGLSYKDLLEITNAELGQRIQLSWPSKIERNMCSVCDSLPEHIRAKILDIVLSTLPAPMHGILHSTDTTGNKAFDAAEARTNEYDEIWSKIKGDVVLTNIYIYRTEPSRSCDLLPYYKFSTVASLFDVSYHWLLGLDDKTCILAKHGDTEMIMDAFCMLPDSWKQRIYAGVKEYADTAKKEK